MNRQELIAEANEKAKTWEPEIDHIFDSGPNYIRVRVLMSRFAADFAEEYFKKRLEEVLNSEEIIEAVLGEYFRHPSMLDRYREAYKVVKTIKKRAGLKE